MKVLFMFVLVFESFVFAADPPANYPVVKGIVRKIDHTNMKISVKHEEIPNLDMPGMTMWFKFNDHAFVTGLAVDDKIKFVVDEINNEYTVLWIEKDTASELPKVKGIIRKINLDQGQITIKHEKIPNLDMPGMTMSFLVQDPKWLENLKVGDHVLFTVIEEDSEYLVTWLALESPDSIGFLQIVCNGVAHTQPKTSVLIEINKDKFSTIRYEHIEGPYKGTAHVNSIGRLNFYTNGEFFEYRSGQSEWSTKLSYKIADDTLTDSTFTHYSSGMKNQPVDCHLE